MSKDRIVRLGEVARLDLDVINVEPTSEYAMVGVFGFGRGLIDRGVITGAETRYARLQRLRAGQLIYSRLKAFEGAVAVVPDEFDGFYASQEFPTFTLDAERASAAFVAHLCRWPDFWSALARESRGVGARRERLHPDEFLSLEIPLPDVKEQRRVAAVLDSVASSSERVTALADTAAELSEAAMAAIAAAPGPFVRLAELLERVERAEAIGPERTYSLLGVRWYGEGLFVREQKEGRDISASRLYRVCAGDFVYNRLFAWKGSFALASGEFDGFHVSNEFPTFTIDESRLEPAFLMAVFRDPRMWDAALERSTGGTPTSRNRLKQERFLDLAIALPLLAEQRRIASLINSVDQATMRRRSQRERAAALGLAILNREFARLTP